MSKKFKVSVRPVSVKDGFGNIVTGIGHNNAKMSANGYFAISNMIMADSAYRASTWYRKIVNIPAQDAVRAYRSWKGSKEQIQSIEAVEKRLGIKKLIFDAIVMCRHRGGCAIAIMADGNTEEELRLDTIKKDAPIKFILFAPEDLTAGEKETDPESPNYRNPKFWTFGNDGRQKKLHYSRMVVLNGRKVPASPFNQNSFWGDSIFVQLSDSVMASDASAGIVSALLHEAKIDVVRTPNMINSMASAEAEAAYIRRWTMAATLKSISNVLMLDGSDEYNQKQVSFTGLPDVVVTLIKIMCGAADIPYTRMTGEQQTGLSGADNGSLRNYYDSITSMQELELSPALSMIDEIIIRIALGFRDETIWYEWNPLWTMSDKEKAEIEKIKSETVLNYERSGLIESSSLAAMLQNRMIESGAWPDAEAVFKAAKEENEREIDVSSEEDDVEETGVTDATPRTLYIHRKVVNGKEILAHYAKQGFKTALSADDLHVTIAYSETPVDWMKTGSSWNDKIEIAAGGARIQEGFGDDGSVSVLLFNSSELSWRHEEIKRAGASFTHAEYQPHITISYNSDNPPHRQVEPYRGKIILAEEVYSELNTEWKEAVVEEDLT